MAEGSGEFDEGKKLFDLLNKMFVQDPEIEEIDFIFCPDCVKYQENDQIAMVNEKHKLGIQSWAVKPLYMFVYNVLIHQRKIKNIEVTETLQLSRALLLLSAECYTAWNIRKDLIISGLLSVDDDLCFSSLVLSKYPRSAETFSHRQWTINQYTKQKGKSVFSQQWLRKELSVCLYCADHYPDNYVAWTHRGWIMEEFIDSKKKLTAELCSMEKWVQMHVSDHCGYHFRQKIIKKLKNISSTNELAALLQDELVFVTKLQESFPGHESTWYHRRFIVDFLHRWIKSLPHSSLQELNSHFSLTSTPSTNSTIQQCWMPCVMTLSSLCQTALVKVRSSHGSNKTTQTSSLPPRFPSYQSELDYCSNILRKSKESQRIVIGYRKWLQLQNGRTTDPLS